VPYGEIARLEADFCERRIATARDRSTGACNPCMFFVHVFRDRPVSPDATSVSRDPQWPLNVRFQPAGMRK
jgi:hypothetical protein